MGLFDPAWMSGKPSKERKAQQLVDKENDPAKLFEIARKAPNWSVRLSAARKLTDQGMLEEIALGDPVWAIREEAVKRLTGVTALARVAQRDKEANVRMIAVGKLTDQDVLKGIFKEDESPQVRATALLRIGDVELVKKSAWCDQEKSPTVRLAALKQLSGDKALAKSICAMDPSYQVQKYTAEIAGIVTGFAGEDQQDMQESRAAAASGRYADWVKSHTTKVECEARDAINYIAYEVNLGMEPDVRYLEHAQKLRRAIDHLDGQNVNGQWVQKKIADFLVDIGNGRHNGTHFPTQAYKLVHFLSGNKALLERVKDLNSRVYEYQKIKQEATVVYNDCGWGLPEHKLPANPVPTSEEVRAQAAAAKAKADAAKAKADAAKAKAATAPSGNAAATTGNASATTRNTSAPLGNASATARNTPAPAGNASAKPKPAKASGSGGGGSKISASSGSIAYKPYTGGGVCDVCNRSLSDCKAYMVPNHTFYNSRKYREFARKSSIAALFGVPMTDAYFAQMEARDHSAGSAVCESCISMF
ncbi:MAG: hypothetical protein LBR77_02355 [Lachnospiraceae bacterium]|jgi:hypothetical protein|nr:hypothetical protein [Lachnospiraceae bacterium]